MPTPATQRFIAALDRLEATGDAGPLVSCFTADASLSNLSTRADGEEGARRFWTSYRRQFRAVRSTFTDVIEATDRSALTWTSKGSLPNGEPIEYRGASFLVWQGERICRFETIYDSAAFTRQTMAK